MRIEGRCAIVTGAASGLGRASAEWLYRAGAKVMLADRDTEIEAVARQLGDRAVPFVLDVCDPEQIERALCRAEEILGPVYMAVNCAGISSAAKTVSNAKAHDFALWRRVIDVNLSGTFYFTSLAAVHMSRNPPDPASGECGVIVNTASIAAFDGQRGQAAYAASKAGIVGMTLPVARDLADQAIRCVALAPGLFDTPLLKDIPASGRAALERSLLFPQRPGQAREFASLVGHVIENDYLNATCLRLDGGARLGS